MDFEQRDRYDIHDLVRVVALLRDPQEGCPWDKVQTHASIRMNFLEEAYEAADAIDSEDPAALQEELGDVLLQILLHSQMEAEKQRFTFDDVCDGICKKLVFRHPHIFANAAASDADEVLDIWNRQKKTEKNQQTLASQLDAVPAAFPALMRAEKLQKRAAKAGLDTGDAAAAAAQLTATAEQLELAASPEQLEKKLGELLFAAVNTARKLKIDPELALTRTADQFAARAKKVEQLAGTAELGTLPADLLAGYQAEANQCFP